MPVTGTAVSNALAALRYYTRQVDRAAEQIAFAGLADVTTEPEGEPRPAAPAPEAESPDLASAMFSMLVAQRAFSAQLRVLRTADEMLRESVDVVK